MTGYDSAFFDYVNAGAARSAARVLPCLLNELQIRSVLDVGCGQGAWLNVWLRLGVTDVVGIDGAYVDRSKLAIPVTAFRAMDLTAHFCLGQRFDLVQSLEVAEHLPESSAASFVGSLVQHGDIVLFSAAPPGQGGDNHVNERDYEYWRHLFAARDYVPVDYVRPLVREDLTVEPWYRFNTLLYVSRSRLEQLPTVIRQRAISNESRIADIAPLLYKLRRQLVRLLPVPVATKVAKIKERIVARKRGAIAVSKTG
jgi:SAM-dependent methyltransferase